MLFQYFRLTYKRDCVAPQISDDDKSKNSRKEFTAQQCHQSNTVIKLFGTVVDACQLSR